MDKLQTDTLIKHATQVVGPSWFGEGPGGHEYDNRSDWVIVQCLMLLTVVHGSADRHFRFTYIVR